MAAFFSGFHSWLSFLALLSLLSFHLSVLTTSLMYFLSGLLSELIRYNAETIIVLPVSSSERPLSNLFLQIGSKARFFFLFGPWESGSRRLPKLALRMA